MYFLTIFASLSRQDHRPRRVADEFRRALDHAVALAGRAGLDPTGGREAENRFFAADFVFILGISISWCVQARLGMPLWPAARDNEAGRIGKPPARAQAVCCPALAQQTVEDHSMNAIGDSSKV